MLTVHFGREESARVPLELCSTARKGGDYWSAFRLSAQGLGDRDHEQEYELAHQRSLVSTRALRLYRWIALDEFNPIQVAKHAASRANLG